jgi:hypothetical protein
LILIVGSEYDGEIDRFLARVGPDRAIRLNARDLSAPGWRLSPEEPGYGLIVASGNLIEEGRLSGVLVRRLAVYQQELTHIDEEDRAYAASELTALLAGWLASISVPVINRPAQGVLCGPFARTEQWLALGAHIGLPVAPQIHTRKLRPPLPPPHVQVTVVDDIPIGVAPASLADSALVLARTAGAMLLHAEFDPSGRLQGANSFPTLDDAVVDTIAVTLLGTDHPIKAPVAEEMQ